MTDRFDIEQVIRILGLEIRADQADEGRDFDVACRIALEKLRKCKEYDGLEKQGLLLKLPCKIGDKVYVVGSKCLANLVSDEECDNNECDFCKYDMEYVVFDRVVDERLLMDILYEKNSNFIFGKTVFTTYEEASKRLNEVSN